MSGAIPDPFPDHWAALVPELLVRDAAVSTGFYCDILGFSVRYARPEDGFAYLEMGHAQIMLEQITEGCWQTGPLQPPLGRGVNFQIEVADIAALEARVLAAGLALFRPHQIQWYRDGDLEHGQAEFLLQDPDGYLLRFMQALGTRPAG